MSKCCGQCDARIMRGRGLSQRKQVAGSTGQNYGEQDRDRPVRSATLQGLGANDGICFEDVM